MRFKILTAALLLAAPAFAQTTTAPMNSMAPNATAPTVVNPGGPGVVNSGPGATGTIQTEGTGAGSISNNSAGASNAQNPSRASSTPSGSSGPGSN
jgi:hypothetical protein